MRDIASNTVVNPVSIMGNYHSFLSWNEMPETPSLMELGSSQSDHFFVSNWFGRPGPENPSFVWQTNLAIGRQASLCFQHISDICMVFVSKDTVDGCEILHQLGFLLGFLWNAVKNGIFIGFCRSTNWCRILQPSTVWLFILRWFPDWVRRNSRVDLLWDASIIFHSYKRITRRVYLVFHNF